MGILKAYCGPFLTELPDELSAAKTRDQLPASTQKFLRRIEASMGMPIAIVSVGPGREQTIVRQDPLKD